MEQVPPEDTHETPAPPKPEPPYDSQIAHTIWELERSMRRGRPSEASRRALLSAHVEHLRMLEERLGVAVESRSQVLLQGRIAPGALLIPGEREGCERLRNLAEHLYAGGFTVLASSLAYRSFDRPGVAPTYWQTCLDEAENRYDMLDHYASRVAVVGVGLGAAVALHLAARKRVHAVAALFPVFDAAQGWGERLRAFLRRALPRAAKVPAGWSVQRRMAARQAQGKVAVPLVVVAEERSDRSDAGRSLRAVRALMGHKPLQLLLIPEGSPATPEALPAEILAQLVGFLSR
jgi:pimeloyl-ACP methyl ester carboxylesterase